MSKNKKKLLILMDWKPPVFWDFRIILERHFKVDVFFSFSPKGFNSYFEKIIFLWKSYIVASFSAFTKIKNYDILYAWNAVLGLLVAFYCRCFRREKPKIVIAQLIIPNRGQTFNQRCRFWFIKFSLERIMLAIVHSRIEVEQFGRLFENNKTEFAFVPLGIKIAKLPYGGDGTIFSGGRSNRDYATLFSALEEIKQKCIVATQKLNVANLVVPKNVELKFNLFGKTFDTLLNNASLIVIPLDREDESSGQLVLLQAMAAGKAIIVTKNRGIEDYVVHNHNAIVVPAHDVVTLRGEIERLFASPSLMKKLALNAQNDVKQFSRKNQAVRVAQLLQALN